METSFFKPLAELGITGNWTLSIQIPQTGPTTVSVLFKPETCGDQAHKLVQPILLKGEPGEIDTGFFSAITQPVTASSALFLNMESHQKSLSMAKTQSKMTTDQKKKEAPAKTASAEPARDQPNEPSKEEKRKAWEEIMICIDELKGRMKYQEAIDLLPKAEDYPEKKDELAKLAKQLQQWLAQFTLFAQD